RDHAISPPPRRRAPSPGQFPVTEFDRAEGSLCCGSTTCATPRSPQSKSILFDSDDLRLPGDDALGLDGVQRTTHRILRRRVGDENDRRRRGGTFRVIAAMGPAARVPLYDRFKRNVLVRQMLRDSRERAGPVESEHANIVAAFVALHRRLAAL